MRAAAGIALLLVACSPKAADAPAGDLVDCAIGGAASFAHDCSVDRTHQNGEPLIVVRDPAGGFRRFTVLDGGKSVGAADGAEALAVASNGQEVDVSIDGDRYRFPAKMLSDAAGR